MSKENLQAALAKQGAFGKDIDLNQYDNSDVAHVQSEADISEAGKALMEHVGIELSNENRSASFMQVDNTVLEPKVKAQTPLELMNTLCLKRTVRRCTMAWTVLGLHLASGIISTMAKSP